MQFFGIKTSVIVALCAAASLSAMAATPVSSEVKSTLKTPVSSAAEVAKKKLIQTTTVSSSSAQASVLATKTSTPSPSLLKKGKKIVTFPLAGLVIQELKAGDKDGTEALNGRTAYVHYTGWLADAKAKDYKGKKFDSSLDRGKPFGFTLGAGMVIQGWDEGVKGMKMGEQRRLLIPSGMGYGARGAGGVIPPNADLIFDVELMEVR